MRHRIIVAALAAGLALGALVAPATAAVPIATDLVQQAQYYAPPIAYGRPHFYHRRFYRHRFYRHRFYRHRFYRHYDHHFFHGPRRF